MALTAAQTEKHENENLKGENLCLLWKISVIKFINVKKSYFIGHPWGSKGCYAMQ